MGPRPKLAEQNRERSRNFRKANAHRTSKICGICKENKPLNDFGVQSKTFDKKQNRCITCARKINREYARESIATIRNLVFDKLGHKCAKCGFHDKRALQIDHINGDGREDNATHRGIRFYKKILAGDGTAYQILCANCNWIKRHENSEMPKRIE